jgi:hypothetical protein
MRMRSWRGEGGRLMRLSEASQILIHDVDVTV